MTRFIHLGIAMLLLLAAAAEAQNPVPASDSLKVITYNVQFLPGPAAAMNQRKEPEYRAQRIAEEVAKFDIVALEEVFDQKWVDAIANGVQAIWGERFHKLASPMAEGHNYTGGCLLLSKYPFAETNTMVFEHFSKPEDFGFRADGFAAKGVIHARVALDGDQSTIDVFVTHLEARDDSLRPAQYAEMAAFIQRVADPSRPALILGDLNTKGTPDQWDDATSQYSVMMKAFGDARAGTGFVDVWPALMAKAHGGTSEQESTETGKRIDYVLVSNPTASAVKFEPKTIRIDPYVDPKTLFLSDHSAVIAEFTLKP